MTWTSSLRTWSTCTITPRSDRARREAILDAFEGLHLELTLGAAHVDHAYSAGAGPVALCCAPTWTARLRSERRGEFEGDVVLMFQLGGGGL